MYGELVIFSSEHKSLFMKRHVYFMKRHIWRVSYFFHKTVNKNWNLFNLFDQLPENSRKLRFSNFHLENSRTWIFTLWNHILQTQTSLLQPILIYTYLYNKGYFNGHHHHTILYLKIRTFIYPGKLGNHPQSTNFLAL